MSLILGKEMKWESPRQKSRERHVSCRILHDSICYSPNPEVVFLASSERSHVLWGPTYGAIFELDLLWIPVRMIWYVYTNSYGDILLLKVSFRGEVVTSGIISLLPQCLTSAECQRQTSRVWPWSGAPKVRMYGTKVRMYGTYLDGLRHKFATNWML